MLRFMILLLVLAFPVQAEVYKWVDEKGNIHYGDKPVGNSEQIIVPEQTNVQNRLSKEEREEKRKRLLETFAEDRADKKEQQAKQKKQKKKLNRQCVMARDRLKTYSNSRRLYDLDNKGERVILSEKARKQVVDQLAADIKKHCK